MNIVYTFDDNYVDISGVSIYSLLSSNKDEKSISIYIIDGGIQEKNRNMLCEIVSKFNRELMFIKAPNPDEYYGISLDVANWCKANYIRIYLEKLFPEDIDRLLYIDSDTLILENLGDLYHMDMEGKPIAAAYDCSPLPKYQLGLKVQDKYFSDGIMLLDIKKLREINTYEDYRAFLRSRNGKVAYLEQGAINHVMKGKIKLIPPQYNVMTLSIIYGKYCNVFFDKQEPYYTNDEMKAAIKKPAIVHLTGHPLCIRPWISQSNHLYRCKWEQALNNTPYSDCFQYRSIKKNPKNLYIFLINTAVILMRLPCVGFIVANCSKRMRKIRKYRRHIGH